MTDSYRRRTIDHLPRIETLRRQSITTFRSARHYRSKLMLPNDPWHEKIERPSTKHGRSTQGYTGHKPREEYPESGTLRREGRVRGYTGHVPGSVEVCGSSLSLGDESVRAKENDRSFTSFVPKCKYLHQLSIDKVNTNEALRPGDTMFVETRYGSKEKMIRRYEDGIKLLRKRGQTPQGLLNIVQSKLSERISSSSQQVIRLRKVFDYFDFDDCSSLDEKEFHHFLDLNNCYLDNCQVLALFAYLDENKTGGIPWEGVMKHSCASNPKDGTGVLPKMIIKAI